MNQEQRQARQRTFIMAKPEAIQRNLLSKIIKQFEKRGFKLVACKLTEPSRDLMEKHYGEHNGKPFFEKIVSNIANQAVCAMVWEGDNVIDTARQMIGVTNPRDSDPGTIRGSYGLIVGKNCVHGSDSEMSAQREIDLWFDKSELCEWGAAQETWLYEKEMPKVAAAVVNNNSTSEAEK